MNIMISIDSNYIIPAKVMLKSLSVNVKENLDVFLLYSRLDDDQIKKFSEFCAEKCNAIMHPIYMDTQFFNGLPVNDRFPVEACFRILAPFILPDDIDRILWLDADVIVKDNISGLYEMEMGERAIAAARDQGSPIVISECYKRLKLQNNSVYFNSGVLLFDLNKVRKNWSKDSFYEWINNIQVRLEYPDQDILNLVFEKDCRICSDKWNYQIKSWTEIKEEDMRNAAVIHYVGPYKPWSYKYENKTKWIWWDFYRMCFGKREFYVFCIKNTGSLLYRKYLEKKIKFVKSQIKRILVK